MPGKSQHGKGKHPHQSKKSKAKLRQSTMTFQSPVAAEMPKPAANISAPPTPRAPTPPTRLRAAHYPYIGTELRRIGILAGIILVILIVLAVVLS